MFTGLTPRSGLYDGNSREERSSGSSINGEKAIPEVCLLPDLAQDYLNGKMLSITPITNRCLSLIKAHGKKVKWRDMETSQPISTRHEWLLSLTQELGPLSLGM